MENSFILSLKKQEEKLILRGAQASLWPHPWNRGKSSNIWKDTLKLQNHLRLLYRIASIIITTTPAIAPPTIKVISRPGGGAAPASCKLKMI